MKNLLMILFFATGFAVNNTQAQTCTPCPPECVMAPCASACKSSAASVNVKPTGVASFASFSPEAMTTDCVTGTMSKKEVKACQAKCGSAAPKDGAASAKGAPATVNQANVVSQVDSHPACTPKPEKQ